MEEKRKLKKPLWIRKAVIEQNPLMTPPLFYSRKYTLDNMDKTLLTTRYSSPEDLFHSMNMN